MKRLAIVSGAGGMLGKAYLDAFKIKTDWDVLALSRSFIDGGVSVKTAKLDLLDKEAVADLVDQIDFALYEKIVLIHPVGQFKFEKEGKPVVDIDGDGIDDEVFSSNITTLENILGPVLRDTKELGTSVLVCAFGSISDRHAVPFWTSYSKAKNILRTLLQKLALQEEVRGRFAALFVNVSSVQTANEDELRPMADKAYWLDPREIVAKTLVSLTGEPPQGYTEMDIFTPMPGFEEDYFQNHPKVLAKWQKEMGL